MPPKRKTRQKQSPYAKVTKKKSKNAKSSLQSEVVLIKVEDEFMKSPIEVSNENRSHLMKGEIKFNLIQL